MTSSRGTTMEELAARIAAGEMKPIEQITAIASYGERRFQRNIENPFTRILDVFPLWGQDYEQRLLRWAEYISRYESC